MKNNNYITITGWMRNVHDLKGNELLLYAIIYGFCQDGESEFKGASKYLEESTGASKSAVRASLKRLEEKGLIERRLEDVSGLTLNRFKALKGGADLTRGALIVCDGCAEIECDCTETTRGDVSKQHEGGADLTPNNTINNTIKDITKDITIKRMSEIEISSLSTEEEVKYFEVAKAFHSLFIKNLKDKKISAKKIENGKYKDYVTPIRLMYERDEVTDEQFRTVFKYLSSPAGDFWTANILSTAKLRKQFTTLLLQNGRQESKNIGSSIDPAEKTRNAIENYVRESTAGD